MVVVVVVVCRFFFSSTAALGFLRERYVQYLRSPTRGCGTVYIGRAGGYGRAASTPYLPQQSLLSTTRPTTSQGEKKKKKLTPSRLQSPRDTEALVKVHRHFARLPRWMVCEQESHVPRGYPVPFVFDFSLSLSFFSGHEGI